MNRRRVIKYLSVLCGIAGIAILVGTFYPIVAYDLMSKNKYPQLISPLVKGASTFVFDDTKASSWFVGSKFEAPKETNVFFYTLSIPKLKIDNATVAIGGEDLSKSLIQYPGTSNPGLTGNTVVFGHSILPIFYDPKNYMAIFSTLPTMDEGDKIFIDYDGVKYKYIVEKMFEVVPTDLSVLEQDGDDSYLSLITCTPPGDPRKPRRLIVKARISDFNDYEVIRN